MSSTASRTHTWHAARWAAALLAAVCFAAPAADDEAARRADEIKAVFIYKFTSYITWPDDTDAVFTIAVLGENRLLNPLKAIAEKKTVDARPLVVRECANIDDLAGAHIVLLSESMEGHLEAILKKAEAEKMLTVSNSPGLAQKGVAIDFITVEDRIGFEMNMNAVKRAGLTVSSQLVKLAALVEENRPPDTEGAPK